MRASWNDLPAPTPEEQQDPWLYMTRNKQLLQQLIAADINRLPRLLQRLSNTPVATYDYYMHL